MFEIKLDNREANLVIGALSKVAAGEVGELYIRLKSDLQQQSDKMALEGIKKRLGQEDEG